MIRLITANLNGVRSAARKGFFKWIRKQDADAICLQELKAQESDLELLAHEFPDYQGYYHCALKKGYSGVGILTRHTPLEVNRGLGWSIADDEGRYLQLDFEKLSLVSLYLPSGTSGDERQTVKYDFLERYEKHLERLSQKKREFIICGDWNIAHTEKDLTNWRANQKCSGFLPKERAWMDKLFGPLGFVDAFRVVNQEAEQYTWWSQRSKTAWERNVGWRIDYQVITPGLKNAVKSAFIYRDERFSDHAPLVMDYKAKNLIRSF